MLKISAFLFNTNVDLHKHSVAVTLSRISGDGT